MLQAITADVARLPNCSVVTTLEAGLSVPLDCEVIPVESPAHESDLFQQLLKQVDAVLVIAPETDGVLAERCRRVQVAGVASWNCSVAAIELCGDKLRLADHLLANGLPTIPTRRADLEKSPSQTFPVVLKPQDGAGSNLTFLVRNGDEWARAANSIREAAAADKCIEQPYISGQTLSIGVNISLDGQQILCLAVAEQNLSTDGGFKYQGGVIPASISPVAMESIEKLATEICRVIPGLAGYIGVDLILTGQGEPLIVEINPRLTTSYVGYRQLYSTILPRFWLSPISTTLSKAQESDQIRFVIS